MIDAAGDDLKGAGADLVTIGPRATTPTGSSIAGATPNIRSGIGNIVTVNGAPTRPLQVDDLRRHDRRRGRPRPRGRLRRRHRLPRLLRARWSTAASPTSSPPSSADAYTKVGGWRGALPGYGVVQTSATTTALPDERVLEITHSRIDRYNAAGVLIDGATNDTAPFVASGVTNKGIVAGSQVVGRVECANCSRRTATAADVGLLTTGPLFGQDGIRVTTDSRVAVDGSLVSQNLVNGTGAPARVDLHRRRLHRPDHRQRQPAARRRHPPARRLADDVLARQRPDDLLLGDALEHRRQRLRRPQPRRRRRHRRDRHAGLRDRARQRLQGREQLVGPRLLPHRRTPARRSARRPTRRSRRTRSAAR